MNREMELLEIERTLAERPDIVELLNTVKDDPILTEIAITLVSQLQKEEDIPLSETFFFSPKDRAQLESKAVDGIIPFDDYTKTLSEISNKSKAEPNIFKVNPEAEEILRILGKQYFPEDNIFSTLDYIMSEKEYEPSWSMMYAYNYGYIQGIREERSRKKRGKPIDRS